MYSRIRRETSTLRKQLYYMGKHTFPPLGRIGVAWNCYWKHIVFSFEFRAWVFRASFTHVGVKIEPTLVPRCLKMNPKMNQKGHQINSWSNNVPKRLQNTNLPPQRGPQGIHFEHLGCPKWPKFNIFGCQKRPRGLPFAGLGAPKCVQEAIWTPQAFILAILRLLRCPRELYLVWAFFFVFSWLCLSKLALNTDVVIALTPPARLHAVARLLPPALLALFRSLATVACCCFLLSAAARFFKYEA